MVQFYLLVVLVGIARCGLLEFNGTFEDYFLYTTQNQVDHSVNPCDDFYRHVCPKTLNTTVIQYSESIVQYFLNESNKIYKTPLPISEIERLYKVLLPSLASDKDADNIIEEVADRISGFLNNLRKAVYLMSFMSLHNIRTNNEYNFLQKLVNHMLAITKKELEITNQNSPYFEESSELGNALNNIVVSLGLQKEKSTFVYFQIIQDNLDNAFNNHFILHNISKITDLDVVARKDEFGRILSEVISPMLTAMGYFDEPLYRQFRSMGFNAMNIDNDITIFEKYLLPATVTSKASKYGYIGGVLGHEMMHSFFTSETYERAELVAKKSLCSMRHVHRVDEEFNKNYRNRSASFSSFEDTADHEGTKLAYKAFLEEFGDLKNDNIATGVNITNQQMFFYAWAAGHCVPNGPGGSLQHSPLYVRVNGALSLINGFHETFQCQEDDRMKRIANGENCNLLGNPVR